MKVFFTLLLSLIALFATAQSSDCTLDLGPDVTVCNNARFTLNPHPLANDGQYTWTGSIGLSCYNCPSPEVSGLNTGTYTFIATVNTPDCMDSDTIRVFVINGEAPAYAIAESMGICAGDSVSIGGPAVSGTFYNWFSVPPGFASNLANPKVKPSGPVTYYLSTSTATCPLLSLDSVRITPVALSLQLTPTDTVRLCLGKSRTLQATVSPAGQTISWLPGAGLQISGNGATAVATPLESTMYTATASLAGCTRQQRVYLALDSLPKELDIQPADTSICLGETVILKSTTYNPDDYLGISSKWTPLNGLLYSDTLFNNVVQPSQTTLFRRITRKGLCIDTSFALVKVIPTAQMITSPVDTFICPGNTVLLSLSFVTPGVTNIEWSPANGLSCTKCTSTFATPVNTQTYSVSGEYQGCPVNASATVHLKPLPPLHFPNDRQLCAGESVQLNDQFDLMSTYVWTSTHPGFGTVTKADPSFTPTQTATYTVVADNGCIRKDSVTIVLNKAILTVKGDTTICKNFTATLSASATLPEISYVWVDKNTGQTVGTGQTIQVKPDVTTTYAVIYTYGDNCQLTDDVTVTINGEAPVLVIPTDVRICPDETVTLNSGPVLSGTIYNWVASPLDPTLMATSATPVVSPDQTTMYSVVATLGNCSVAQQIKITADNATLSVTPDTTVCDSTLTTLRAMGSAPDGSYAWSTGAQSSTINVMPAGNTTYTVTYTYGEGCILQESVNISVVQNFNLGIDAFPDTSTLNVGQQVNLIAIVNPPQSLSNFNFVWQEITVDTKVLPFNTESINVVASSNDTTTKEIRYVLIATSPKGCVQRKEIRFNLVFPFLLFPNAFTPDGDQVNDAFGMIVLKGLAYVARMEIFNRWGQIVYQSTDEAATWDGMIDGKEAPADVYVYRVWWRRGDDALQVLVKGDVTLLR